MNEATEPFDVPALRARLLAQMGQYAGDYPHQLERQFPRILAKVTELWGTARLDGYLESLMLPDRQDRQGFPLDVAMDILRLTRISATLSSGPTHDSSWAVVEESARDKKLAVDK